MVLLTKGLDSLPPGFYFLRTTQVKPVLAPKSLNAVKSFRPIAANDDAQVRRWLCRCSPPPPPHPPPSTTLATVTRPTPGTPHTLTLHTLRTLRTLRAAPTRACHAWLGAPLAGATRVRVSTEDGDRRATLAPRPPLAQAGVARGAASRSVTRLGGGARRRPGWPATPEIAPGDEPLERPWHVHVFMMCLWRAYGVTWCLWDAR